MKRIIKAIEWFAVIGGIALIIVVMLGIWSVDRQADKQNIKDAKQAAQPKTELIYEYHNSAKLVRIYRKGSKYQLINYKYTHPKAEVSGIEQTKEIEYDKLPTPHLPNDKTHWVYSYQNKNYPRAH